MAYGISKLAVEQLGRSYRALHGLECIHIRTCWVYGPHLPRSRIPKNLLDAALAGRPLHLTEGGDFIVDHTHISDCVQGIVLALDKSDHPFDAYNIGSGQATSVREMVEIVKSLVPGADLSVGPGNYTYGGGMPMVKKGALDISRARQVLGYEPRFDLRAGLADYLREARSRPG
jgi:nucleoside-diphosphate-sugar epimerase